MEQKEVIYRKDYRRPDFLVPHIDLYFDLGDECITVSAALTVRFDGSEGTAGETPFVLDGEDMELLSLEVDGKVLTPEDYQFGNNRLIVTGLGDESVLKTVVRIDPYNNTSLMGIYKSGDILCSQCEAEGFRRITPFPDHPDILTRYRVTIEGSQPVMLSNGNLVAEEKKGARRIVTWEDPFPKPCYLFALVAGDLGHIEDSFTTCSGKNVPLRIYTDKGNEERAWHAMDALKKAMKWDEDTFGLEYDLDLFMIVAVDAFNFGAMENKGLNIFNSSCVLSDREITTDAGLDRISGIVAHEYFHNWTGNRVTCRDWFQLTLKEGLTVFRDQSFSADTTSCGVSRVEQATYLKQIQFPQDSGPNSHPIRPESYREIDNFYTPTVYRKGAAVIRMIETLAGKGGFRKGIDEYFRRHDGQAVTCEDFLLSMEAGGGVDLSRFRRWYSQAGTPRIKARTEWDGADTLTLSVSQHTPPSADGSPKEPFLFPLNAALWYSDGSLIKEETLVIEEEEQSFVFSGLGEKPVISLLRDFSAPVIMEYDQPVDDLLFVLERENDAFSRFNASRELFLSILKGERDAAILNKPFASLLNDENGDRELTAWLMTLPSVDDVADLFLPLDFEKARKGRNGVKAALGKALESEMLSLYRRLSEGNYVYDRTGVGRRALRGVLLDYLVSADKRHLALAEKQYYESDNMTDSSAALRILSRCPGTEKEKALAHYFDRWKEQFLPLTQWFAYYAGAEEGDVLADVVRLEQHKLFRRDNPNMVRALFGSFAANRARFHLPGGHGYRFVAEKIRELDKINPGMAAGLSGAFYRYSQLEDPLKKEMKTALESILASGPSAGVLEIVENTLKSS